MKAEMRELVFSLINTGKHIVCGRVPWLYQYWPGGFMIFVVLCPGTPEGSTSSGSGFKASQKTGQRLKVSSDRLGEAGNRTGKQCWIKVIHCRKQLTINPKLSIELRVNTIKL